MPLIISVKPLGQLANRMIAYLCARSLAWMVGEDVTINCSLPEWNLTFDESLHRRLDGDAGTRRVRDRDLVSIRDLYLELSSSRYTAVVLEGYFQRLPLFDFQGRARDLFPSPEPLTRFEGDDLVIHVRAGDILEGVPWYPLVPIEFYRSLIERTGLNPVFLGQLEDSRYVREIRDAFPGARFMPAGSPLADFARLRSARHLCLSVSTFSWLAAWLSEAREIHYPLLGFLHPQRFPHGAQGLGGIDLTPVDDQRYRFHLFPELQGSHEEEYLDFTRRIRPISKEVPRSVVKRLQAGQPTPVSVHVPGGLDEAWYLQTHLDAAWDISQGWYFDALSHYAEIGFRRGLPPRRPLYLPRHPNVALGKPASQSSTSAWSLADTAEQDARRAVDGNPAKDLGFHTSLEANPWWSVDLGAVHEIECVNLFNRRSEVESVRRRALPMALEISLDGITWTRARYLTLGIHSVREFVAGSGPYQWVADAGHRARYVKLTVLKLSHLHLAQVEVYGAAVSR